MRYTLRNRADVIEVRGAGDVLRKLECIKQEIATISFNVGEKQSVKRGKEYRLFRLMGKEEACRWFLKRGVI